MKKRRFVTVAIASVLAAAGGAFGVTAAQAASCGGSVHYTPGTNTITLTGGKSFTLTRIVEDCPEAPLERTSKRSRTWELAADLLIRDGSTLILHGSKADGDVNTLRIRSLSSNKATEVQQITAAYGTIDIDATTITSWDTKADGPDTDATLPSGSSGRGRAFIRAVSSRSGGGKAELSTMTIRDSTLSYLGYRGTEAYGVAYKSRGCDRDHVSACKKVKVTGEQIDSTFDHNYMGTYAWGAYGIVFRGNTYSNSISYGLDPHDVSSNLIIDHNRFTHNGNHGLICSQLCDRLTITHNIADHNGMRPNKSTAVDDTANGIHGIMLHRGITRSTITDNTVTDQPHGAGIAIFDSTDNTVSGNTLKNNLYGIRVTAGSADNTFTDNSITDSAANAILLLPGSDKAAYSTRSGRPTRNTFTDNTISGTGKAGIRVIDADKNVFRGKSMSKIGKPLQFVRAVDNTISDVDLPKHQPITITGSSAIHSTLTLNIPRKSVVVTADKYSTVDFR